MNYSLKSSFVGCDAVQCCGRIPAFRRTLLHPSSGWRCVALQYDTNVSEDLLASIFRVKWRQRQQGPPKRWYPSAKLQGLTVGILPQRYTASQPGRPGHESSPQRKSQIWKWQISLVMCILPANGA